MADPSSQSVNTAAFERVLSIEATAESQVTIRFSEPDSQFRNSLAGPAGIVSQKEFTSAAGDTFGSPSGGLMCTGPFALKEWTAGSSVTLRANENYWGGKPLVNEIELKFLSSDSTMVSALLAGEIDGAFDVPAASAASIAKASTGKLFSGPSTASISFGPATAEGPAADPRVREALDLAIDKRAFVSAVLNGYGEPQKTLVPPFAWHGLEAENTYRTGYEALPDNTGNLSRAKEIMAQVKIDDPNLVLAISAGEQQSVQTATIIQAAGKELGLNIEIKQLQGSEFGDMFYDETARQGIDFVATTGYLETPGVLLYPSYFVLPDGLFNWSKYSNPEAAGFLRTARTETDPTKSAEAFISAQRLFGPDRLQVTLASQHTRVFLNNRLSGVTVSFAYINSPWALHLGGQ
jgi:peptide/nickel transport system substrate-binding protein